MICLSLAGVSFVIAALSAFGVILANDTVGRMIFATVWGAIGIAWTGRYLVRRRQAHQKAESPKPMAGSGGSTASRSTSSC